MVSRIKYCSKNSKNMKININTNKGTISHHKNNEKNTSLKLLIDIQWKLYNDVVTKLNNARRNIRQVRKIQGTLATNIL